MDVSGLLANGRRVLAGHLTDTCTITEAVGDSADYAVNQTSGALVPPSPATTEIYRGPCRVVARAAVLTDEQGARVEVSGYEALIPFDAALPPIGAVLTVVDSRYDPSLVGASFRLTDVDFATDILLRRLHMQSEGAAVPRAGGR